MLRLLRTELSRSQTPAFTPENRLHAVNVFGFSARSITGTDLPLDAFRGQVCLIVNVASECGFTPQYTGLEALYVKHRDRGFTVLGFPCNQFGQQEPGDDASILTFCIEQYAVTFPLFAKIAVNGPNTHPLFQHLKSERRGLMWTETIKWNFTKFLVARDGTVNTRFASIDTPEQIEGRIEELLAL